MSKTKIVYCPKCGEAVHIYKNPFPTVDIIIEMGNDRIVLIERKNPPPGWALPGGFVDYGETLEEAAIREAYEETGLRVKNLTQFRAYSDPDRDPRHHTITVVFVAEVDPQQGSILPKAADDAKNCAIFNVYQLPENLAFDHAKILQDYRAWKAKKFC
ncbi:MAG: NUDIX hydrolase [Thermodesulforhabdaceae bacterium]